MKRKLKQLSFFNSLKWKISLVIIFILVVLLLSISLTIANYSSGIVRNQVSEKINLVAINYKNNVNTLINQIDRQMEIAANNQRISSYFQVVMTLYPEDNASEEEMQSFKDYLVTLRGSQFDAAEEFNILMDQMDNTEFMYATTPDGTTLVDARVRSFDDDEAKYIYKELKDTQYKDISFGKIYNINNKQYLMYNKEVRNPDNGQLWGYLVMGFSPGIIGQIESVSSNDGGTYRLINNQGFILKSENKDMFGTQIKDKWFVEQINDQVDSYAEEKGDNYLLYNRVNDNLSLAVTIPISNLMQPVTNLSRIIWGIFIAALVLGFIATLFFVSRQLKPLGGFLVAFNAMKGGNLTESVKLEEKYLKRKDEIGVMANNFNDMIGELRELVVGIKFQSRELDDSADIMNSTSQEVGTLAEQVGNNVQRVSAGAEEQIAQIEETSHNVINLNSQIQLIDNNAQQISKGADNVLDSIQKGNSSVTHSIERINNVSQETARVSTIVSNLGKMSQEIGNIVDLIYSISNQTNLLALNAAIEAARAGQAGQGFSVVADEIRTLAEQSSEATENIANLIGSIQESVNDAVDVMGHNEDLVAESVQAIRDTDRIFNEIEEVSAVLRNSIKMVVDGLMEMTTESQQVEEAIRDISTISKEFATNSEEIAASSEEQIASTEEIISAAERLKSMSEALMENVNRFEL